MCKSPKIFELPDSTNTLSRHMAEVFQFCRVTFISIGCLLFDCLDLAFARLSINHYHIVNSDWPQTNQTLTQEVYI